MDRRFAWLGAVVGALAVWRWRRRKHAVVEEDPAGSLRARLEESRAAADVASEASVAVVDADPDARRKSVHEDARTRIDELRGE
jgi:hypothetical protein